MPHALSGAPSGPPLSRRRLLLRGGQSVLALTALGAAVAACGSDRASEPDPLEAELAAARSDARLASAAAEAVPAFAPALRVIADERSRHATALIEELARAAGTPTPDPQAADPTTSAEPGPPPAPPTVRDVSEALRRSADSAARLAPTLSGYRAGLLGSIAASCTTAYAVGLPPAGRPR